MNEAVNTAAQSANNFGLGVFLAVAIAGFLAWVIIYVLKTNARREERLAGIIERDIANLKATLDAGMQQTLEFRGRLEENNRRLREEHERADEKLNALMDQKERIAEILQTVSIQMTNLKLRTEGK